jgi:hypothetical protein
MRDISTAGVVVPDNSTSLFIVNPHYHTVGKTKGDLDILGIK